MTEVNFELAFLFLCILCSFILFNLLYFVQQNMFGEILIYYVRRYDVASLLPMQEYGETIRATNISSSSSSSSSPSSSSSLSVDCLCKFVTFNFETMLTLLFSKLRQNGCYSCHNEIDGQLLHVASCH